MLYSFTVRQMTQNMKCFHEFHLDTVKEHSSECNRIMHPCSDTCYAKLCKVPTIIISL